MALRRSEIVRPPAVAGSFYPAESIELRRDVEAHIERAPAVEVPNLRALICPHAGFIYSGPVAGHAYRVLREAKNTGRGFRRVVVLAPAHRVAFRGIAIPECDAFATPLGEVPLWSGCRELAKTAPYFLDSRPHAEEHAIEVQLPFLQSVLGEFELVPLLFGAAISEDPMPILERLLDESTLIVVSTDLSHYLRYEEARRIDQRTIGHFLSLDASKVAESEACGRSPAATMLTLAKRANLQIQLLDYRNSGDTAGDQRKVVGYASMALTAASQSL
jgi:hypothetical protein